MKLAPAWPQWQNLSGMTTSRSTQRLSLLRTKAGHTLFMYPWSFLVEPLGPIFSFQLSVWCLSLIHKAVRMRHLRILLVLTQLMDKRMIRMTMRYAFHLPNIYVNYSTLSRLLLLRTLLLIMAMSLPPQLTQHIPAILVWTPFLACPTQLEASINQFHWCSPHPPLWLFLHLSSVQMQLLLPKNTRKLGSPEWNWFDLLTISTKTKLSWMSTWWWQRTLIYKRSGFIFKWKILWVSLSSPIFSLISDHLSYATLHSFCLLHSLQ